MFNQQFKNKFFIALTAVLIAVSACSNKPHEIHFGSDECAHCKMVIMDEEFATQIVKKTGKAFKFDSIECLAAYTKEQQPKATDQTLWVPDFATVEWVNANDAFFVKSEVIKSPMGMGLLAFKSNEAANNHINQYPGKIISWNELTGFEMKSHSETMNMMKH